MNVLIVENEMPAAERVSRLIMEIDENTAIVAVTETVEETINWLQDNPHPDLILMDIQLDDGLCFEIFETIKIAIPIIFTTAYDQYTLKAFRVNSVDYLLKPVEPKELKQAIEKYHEFFHRNESIDIEKLIEALQPKMRERFLIRIGEHYKSVVVDSINCFYIEERNNFICADSGKNYPIDYSLDRIEKMVDSQKFFRISRSIIINKRAIKDIIAYSSSRLKLIIDNCSSLPEILVSRDRVSDFKGWMDK